MYGNDNDYNNRSEAQPNGYYSYNFQQVDSGSSDRTWASQDSEDTRRYSQPQYQQQKPKKKNTWVKVLVLCLACLIVGGAAGTALHMSVTESKNYVEQKLETDVKPDIPGVLDPDSRKDNGSAPETSEEQIKKNNKTAAELFKKEYSEGNTSTATDIFYNNCDATVGISTEVTATNVWGFSSSYATSGTGFVISEDGYIMTNCHVIDGGSNIKVTFYNGDVYEAEVIGADDVNDIALLKIEATGLKYVTLGSIETSLVGEDVYVIGNPLGELTHTFTTGTLSSLDRLINVESTPINMIQIDAAINSGNSGGPVFNSKGQVIGVVTAKYSSTGVEGIGFAIPIDDAVNIAGNLLDYGYVKGRAYMGIAYKDINASYATYYGMPLGVYVGGYVEGGCAEKAGLQIGDIITAMDGETIKNSTEMMAKKREYAPGDTVELTVYRSGSEIKLKLTFDEYNPNEDVNMITNDTGSSQQNNQQQDNPQGNFINPFSIFGF